MSEDLSIRVREFLKQASTTMEATEQMEKIALSPKYMLAASRKAKKLGRTELKRLTSMESVPNGVRYSLPEGLAGGIRSVVRRKTKDGGEYRKLLLKGEQGTPAIHLDQSFNAKGRRGLTTATVDDGSAFQALIDTPKSISSNSVRSAINASKVENIAKNRVAGKPDGNPGAAGISKSDVAGAGAGSAGGAGAAGEKADSLFSKGKQKAYEAWDKGKGLAKAHPVLAAGIGAVGTGGTTGILGYNMGHSSGQEDTAKLVSDYYKIREAMLQQQLAGANSSLWNRIANVFGAGDLSAIAGGGLDFGAAPVSAERASKVLDELAHQDDIRRSLGI